jgi:hypothetical protein
MKMMSGLEGEFIFGSTHFSRLGGGRDERTMNIQQ